MNELQRSIVPSRGLFALGKFDHYKEDIPYASLAQAFRNLIAMILSQNDTELIRWACCASGSSRYQWSTHREFNP